MRWLAFLLALVVLSGCIKPPPELARGPFAETTVVQAQEEVPPSARVRWGGTIARTLSGKDETCFEVVGRRLDATARPLVTDDTTGRFLACAPGFYEPEVYAEGRALTVIGTVQEVVPGTIGDFEYRYPRLAAEEVYLWPRRVPRPRYGGAYYGPYPYYPYYYGAWGYPFISPPLVRRWPRRCS